MNTRQIRLSDPEQIKRRMNDFIGKKITIVLQDSMVFLGSLLTVKENTIILLNTRNKKVTLSIPAITELFIDSLI